MEQILSSSADGRRKLANEPLFPLDTFVGRLKYYGHITNPMLAFTPTAQLYQARQLVEAYRQGTEPVNTTRSDVFRSRVLCDAAFHPDTGELQNVIGRMTFAVPGGTALIGAMMIFYRSTGAVIFWQWANQSFNALVNYTNRNAKSSLTTGQIASAYLTATTGALGVSLGLRHMLSNAIAAIKGVSLVTFCRILMVTPPMFSIPFIMEALSRKRWYAQRQAMLNFPIQLGLSTIMVAAMIPTGCALFPQRNWVTGQTLKQYDRPAYDRIKAHPRFENSSSMIGNAQTNLDTTRFYFNKGL